MKKVAGQGDGTGKILEQRDWGLPARRNSNILTERFYSSTLGAIMHRATTMMMKSGPPIFT